MSSNGSTLCSPTVEKLLCRSPYFAAVTCRQSAPDSPRERGDSQEGGNRRCLPSCAPARRQRTFPRSAERNSSLDFKRKTPRPLGANTLTQFEYPAQPVLKKTAARIGRTRLRQFASPAQPVQRNRLPPGKDEPPARFKCPRGSVQKPKSSTLFRVLLGITKAYAFLINASRRSRPLSISVSEVA